MFPNAVFEFGRAYAAGSIIGEGEGEKGQVWGGQITISRCQVSENLQVNFKKLKKKIKLLPKQKPAHDHSTVPSERQNFQI